MSGTGSALVAVVAVLLAILAGVLLGTPATLLRIESASSARELALDDDGSFHYRYRQSIYEVIVEEELRVEDDRIRILRARSTDARALEYYRWPSEPYRRGDILAIEAPDLTLGGLRIQVIRGAGQALRAGGRQVDLEQAFGEGTVLVRPIRSSRALWLVAAFAP